MTSQGDEAAYGALVASLPFLLDAVGRSPSWEVAPLAHWLATLRPAWRLDGQGPALDEIGRVLIEAGRIYESCASGVDLLVIEGPLTDATEDPENWTPRLASGAIVLIVGIEAGAGASLLWRKWAGALPPEAAFRMASCAGGVGLLLPRPEFAPPVLRELCGGNHDVARLFDAAIAVAETSVRSAREVRAARAGVTLAKADVMRLLQEVEEIRRRSTHVGGLQKVIRKLSLEGKRARVDAKKRQFDAMLGTTTHRAAVAMRRVGARLSVPARVFLRRSAKVTSWTLSGRLRSELRARQTRRRQHAEALAAPASTQAVPFDGSSMSGVPAAGSHGHGVSFAGGYTPSIVVLGYAVEDADLPRLKRAIERAQQALAVAGQLAGREILIADAGAPLTLHGWLSASVPVLPCRGSPGFAAAHAQLMDLAFAQGADAYAMAELGTRFSDDTLACALRVLVRYGGKALVWAGEWLPEGLPDPRTPGLLLISRWAGERLGRFDESLDGHATFADLCLRAHATDIPVLPLPGARFTLDTGRVSAQTTRHSPRRSLDAAWRLAGRWNSRPLLDEVAIGYAARGVPLPDIRSGEGAGMDVPLKVWWQCRTSAPEAAGPGPVLKATPVPPELCMSLAVPFGFTLPPGAERAVPRLAAIVHLYYEDLAAATRETLRHTPGACDLYITTDSEPKRQAILSAFRDWDGEVLDVRVLPNRGANLGPMLEVLREIEQRYDLLLHLHGKKTPHWQHGEGWRDHLYDSLCGSAAAVSSVLAAFEANPLLGVVFPQHWEPVRPALSWGYSFNDAQDLAGRIGIDLRYDQPLDFPSGAMFWARVAALRPLLDLGLGLGDFDEGHATVTPAHAVERLILRVCEHRGYTWLKVAPVDADQVSPPPVVVRSAAQLEELMARASFLLSDPALVPGRSASRLWRFQPDPAPAPRFTLICAESPSLPQLQALREVCEAQGVDAEGRFVLLPPAGSRCPPPLDVRCRETFLASDEPCAQVALQLCQMQKAYFGRTSPVRRLSEAQTAASTDAVSSVPEGGKNSVLNGVEQ